jgi:hypothetical protein
MVLAHKKRNPVKKTIQKCGKFLRPFVSELFHNWGIRRKETEACDGLPSFLGSVRSLLPLVPPVLQWPQLLPLLD